MLKDEVKVEVEDEVEDEDEIGEEEDKGLGGRERISIGEEKVKAVFPLGGQVQPLGGVTAVGTGVGGRGRGPEGTRSTGGGVEGGGESFLFFLFFPMVVKRQSSSQNDDGSRDKQDNNYIAVKDHYTVDEFIIYKFTAYIGRCGRICSQGQTTQNKNKGRKKTSVFSRYI